MPYPRVRQRQPPDPVAHDYLVIRGQDLSNCRASLLGIHLQGAHGVDGEADDGYETDKSAGAMLLQELVSTMRLVLPRSTDLCLIRCRSFVKARCVVSQDGEKTRKKRTGGAAPAQASGNSAHSRANARVTLRCAELRRFVFAATESEPAEEDEESGHGARRRRRDALLRSPASSVENRPRLRPIEGRAGAPGREMVIQG